MPRPGQPPKHFYGKTKAEVKKKMAEWSQNADAGPLMADILDSWLATKEHEVEYKTLEGYKVPCERIKQSFGSMRLKDIEPSQIQAFINSIAKQGYKRTTVQRPLDVLRMIFDYAINLPGSAIVHNPCSSVRVPKGLEQEHRDLAWADDIERIKNSVDMPFGLFAYMLLYTGLRKAEALAITDKDIIDGRIHITKAISWQPNQPVIKSPKTANSKRTVVILSPLAQKLPDFHGYLFSADGGKSALTQIEFRHRWDAYCKLAGLCDVSEEKHTTNGHTYTRQIYKSRIVPHQLRHEFATLCFDAGLEALDTMQLMGHSNIATTESIYTHIRDTRRASSESKLEALVAKNN